MKFAHALPLVPVLSAGYEERFYRRVAGDQSAEDIFCGLVSQPHGLMVSGDADLMSTSRPAVMFETVWQQNGSGRTLMATPFPTDDSIWALMKPTFSSWCGKAGACRRSLRSIIILAAAVCTAVFVNTKGVLDAE